MQIPLFPLSSLVLPDGMLPLRIFEPRYVDLVKHCFKTDTGFGVCLIQEGKETGKAIPHPIGTLVDITDWDQGVDGLLHITTTGRQRFRILSYKSREDQLLIGEVELLPIECPTDLQEDFSTLAEKLDQLLDQLEAYVKYPEKKLTDAVWVSNRLIELLPLQGKDKMILLQMQCANDRLKVLRQIGFE